MATLLKNNVGKVDRVIRVILGVLLVGNVFVGLQTVIGLSLIHISEPTRQESRSRMPSSA